MVERSEPFSSQELDAISSEKLSKKKQKTGHLITGQCVREKSSEGKKKTSIPRVVQERFSETIHQRRMEDTRQIIQPSPTRKTASLSPRELFERSLRPFISIPGTPQGPFTIEERMKELDVPGVSIGVINDGKVEWTRGYGELRSEERNIHTQLGSIGKIFTSLTLLALIERNPSWFPEGLDTSVVDILEKSSDLGSAFWENFDPQGFLSQGNKITIRMLLSHRAGIVEGASEYYDVEALSQHIALVRRELDSLKRQSMQTSSYERRETLDAQLRLQQEQLNDLLRIQERAKKEKIPLINELLDGKTKAGHIFIKYKPGERMVYSNLGFDILQKVIEIVSGISFLEARQKLVLDKIGMNETTYSPPGGSSIHGNYEGRPISGFWRFAPHPAAGASTWTCVEDIVKLILALQNTFSGKRSDIINQRSAQEMVTSPTGESYDYCLGIDVARKEGEMFFGHGGGIPGFATRLIADSEGHGVIVLTNADEGYAIIPEIIHSIASTYGWQSWGSLPLYQSPIEAEEVSSLSFSVEEWAGTYQFRANHEEHIVIIRAEGEKVIVEIDGTEKFSLIPLGPKLACFRHRLTGPYQFCHFGEEGGRSFLDLFGTRHFRSSP